MKAFAFVAATVVATALLLGGTVLIVLQSPRHSTGLQLLAIMSLVILVYGPLTLGSLRAYWNVNLSDASRRAYRLWFRVITGLEVVGAVGIVAFAILFVAGLLAGALEINLNVQIGRLEALYKRSLMSRASAYRSKRRRSSPSAGRRSGTSEPG